MRAESAEFATKQKTWKKAVLEGRKIGLVGGVTI